MVYGKHTKTSTGAVTGGSQDKTVLIESLIARCVLIAELLKTRYTKPPV